MLGPKLIQVINEDILKIKERIQTTHSRPKSYADIRREIKGSQLETKNFSKVASMKGVLMLWNKREVMHVS